MRGKGGIERGKGREREGGMMRGEGGKEEGRAGEGRRGRHGERERRRKENGKEGGKGRVYKSSICTSIPPVAYLQALFYHLLLLHL